MSAVMLPVLILFFLFLILLFPSAPLILDLNNLFFSISFFPILIPHILTLSFPCFFPLMISLRLASASLYPFTSRTTNSFNFFCISFGINSCASLLCFCFSLNCVKNRKNNLIKPSTPS